MMWVTSDSLTPCTTASLPRVAYRVTTVKKSKCYHVAYECSKCNMKCNDCTQPIIIIVIKIPFLKPNEKIMIIQIH